MKSIWRLVNFQSKHLSNVLGGVFLSINLGLFTLSRKSKDSSPNSNSDPTAVQENILYGAVVGGPGEPNNFSHNDRRDDWVTNEVGTSYNAPLASALIQQYDHLGGNPLSESDLDALIGVDANGVGF